MEQGRARARKERRWGRRSESGKVGWRLGEWGLDEGTGVWMRSGDDARGLRKRRGGVWEGWDGGSRVGGKERKGREMGSGVGLIRGGTGRGGRGGG
jgi:hypothetical protein